MRVDRKMLRQIEAVIDAAMQVQAETGPDPDYRRAAVEALAAAKHKLIEMIDAKETQ